jgi:hypothetical protein
MTQGNTGSQDMDAVSEDEVQLSEDEEEDENIPSLAAPTLKAEMLNPREPVLLQKKSDVFDPTERCAVPMVPSKVCLPKRLGDQMNCCYFLFQSICSV